VFPVPDARWIEAVTAVVVLKEGALVEEAVLLEHARGLLAPFKVPKRIHFAASIPKNTAGKVLKRVLRSEHARGTPD